MALDFYIAESAKEFQKGNRIHCYGLLSGDHHRVIWRYGPELGRGQQTRKIVDYLSDAVFCGPEIVALIGELEVHRTVLRDDRNKKVIDELILVARKALENNMMIFTVCD